MNIVPGDHAYSNIGALLARPPASSGTPLALREYLGAVPAEVYRAFDGKQLLSVSLPGVDNRGRALNEQILMPTWSVAQGIRIAELGAEIFRLFRTKIVAPAHANATISGKIYPRSQMVPITEHTAGDAFTSYGYCFTEYMTQFGKMAHISVEFMGTEDGKREFLEQLGQLSDSYLLTAMGVITNAVFMMPDRFADWASTIPGMNKVIAPQELLLESAQLFAAAVKKNPGAVSTIIKTRCPAANTAFMSNTLTNTNLFGDLHRDPDLYPDSVFPVYKGSDNIVNIVSLPAFPTGQMNEVKDLTRSQAAYTTFMVLPPAADQKANQGCTGALEAYDYRARQFFTLSRAQLYENVAFDMVEDAANNRLIAGDDPATVYADHIAQCNGENKGAPIDTEGFVVLRAYLWGGHAVGLCDNTKLQLLTTGPQLLQASSAVQNTFEVHMRNRFGVHSDDAGASTYRLPIPFVTKLLAGGSAKPYSRAQLVRREYRLFDPRLSDCGLIIIRCSRAQINNVVNQMYIPAYNTWSGKASQKLGTDMMLNIDWSSVNVMGALDELAHNFEEGSFSVGSLFQGIKPQMPEAVFREEYRRLGLVEFGITTDRRVEGCAPHGDMTTAEITGESTLLTRSIKNPDAVTKRARIMVN